MLVYIFTHLDVHNTSMLTFILAFCSVLLSFFNCKSISILPEKIFGTVYCNTESNQKVLTKIVLFLCLLLFQTKCLLTFSHIQSHT